MRAGWVRRVGGRSPPPPPPPLRLARWSVSLAAAVASAVERVTCHAVAVALALGVVPPGLRGGDDKALVLDGARPQQDLCGSVGRAREARLTPAQ